MEILPPREQLSDALVYAEVGPKQEWGDIVDLTIPSVNRLAERGIQFRQPSQFQSSNTCQHIAKTHQGCAPLNCQERKFCDRLVQELSLFFAESRGALKKL